MTKVAYTKIEHGKDDGTLVVIEEGDEVKGLPAEVTKQLAEQGLIGEPLTSGTEKDQTIDELEAENEDLKSQLEKVRAELVAAKTPPDGDKK